MSGPAAAEQQWLAICQLAKLRASHWIRLALVKYNVPSANLAVWCVHGRMHGLVDCMVVCMVMTLEMALEMALADAMHSTSLVWFWQPPHGDNNVIRLPITPLHTHTYTHAHTSIP